MLTNDEELLARCRSGDREAFQELVEKYQHKVFTIAIRYTGNESDACDLAQEVFIKVYQKLSMFRGESSFMTWLYQITANTCKDELRKRPTQQPVSLDNHGSWHGAEVALVRETSKTAGPEEVAVNRELQRNLQLMLNQLPEEQRLILIMREIQGFSYDELAKQLECSLGTVKSRLSRARLALKDLVIAHRELFGFPIQLNTLKGRG